MGYCEAQICVKGHIITSIANIRLDKKAAFCKKCGYETITHSPHCNEPISGKYIDDFELPLC